MLSAGQPEPRTDEPDDGRSDVRLALRRRADLKIARAARIETLRLAGLGHEQIRVQMGLSVEQYRRARRWLRIAVARSVVSPEPITVEEALREHGAHHVATAMRVGSLAAAGYARREIQRLLRIDDDELYIAECWWRDALVAPEPRGLQAHEGPRAGALGRASNRAAPAAGCPIAPTKP